MLGRSHFLFPGDNTDLSTLSCQRRISECVAWRCSTDPARKTHAPSWESTRGHWELPLAPSAYTPAHRTCCGQGVWPIVPAETAQVEKGSYREERGGWIQWGYIKLSWQKQWLGERSKVQESRKPHPFCRYADMSGIAFRGNRRSSLRTCCFQVTSLFLWVSEKA